MNCKKYKLTNNGETTSFFTYQKCINGIVDRQVKLLPGKTKTINLIEGSFVYNGTIQTVDLSLDQNPEMDDNKLGRIYSVDTRDLNFLISDKIPLEAPKTITNRFWQDDIWSGDQGRTPSCVGFAWAHFIEDGPITHNGKHPVVDPIIIYKEAQKIDEWPGENYAGTSVRAGAKYLRATGKISSYLWAYDLTTLVNTVLNLSPVVVGTNWYYSMFFPNKNGLITISGSVAGGHAYLVNGVDLEKQQFRIKNSWGKTWGKNGSAFISFKDMERLIKENGEVCLASEKKF